MLRFTVAVLFLILAAPKPAGAQADQAFALEEPGVLDATRLPDRGETNTLTHAGLSLTVSGLSMAGLGTSLFVPWVVSWGIPGGTLAGIGGLLLMIGMPMWIVGGIRREVLHARPEDRGRVANDYELAGILTTFGSLVVSLAGLGLLLFAGREPAGAISGLTLLPLGAGIAFFIGIPMWAEAARF